MIFYEIACISNSWVTQPALQQAPTRTQIPLLKPIELQLFDDPAPSSSQDTDEYIPPTPANNL